MKHEYSARSLNITAFAKAEGQLTGAAPLDQFERLREESLGANHANPVKFSALGAVRADAAGVDEAWVHLAGQATLSMTCQRCLSAVDVDITFARDFRFVATEELAEIEDEESEEDVLVAGRDFNLQDLVEDELLMSIPPVPKHETCPTPVKLAAVDVDFAEEATEKPNPFAVLQQLKKKDLG